MSGLQLVLAILGLGFLILVHEFGHYIVARWCGMHVERFSIGFGPPLLKWTDKRGTIFQLAPIPFGGFAQIKGMHPLEDIDPNDKQAYGNHPAWQRFLAILAGPAANYLAAIIVAAFVFYSIGAPAGITRVAEVGAEYDAFGKLQPGDEILAVNGVPLAGDSLSSRVNASSDMAITLSVQRSTGVAEVVVARRLVFVAPVTIVYRLGVTLDNVRVPVSLGHAMARAVTYPVHQSAQILHGFKRIIRGEEKADVGGPVRIVEELHNAAKISFTALLSLLMMLSVYVGLFNLLPFPALDGGRLLFLAYELITRRRANPRVEANIHMIGIALLLPLMVLVLFKDCARFVP